MHGFTIGILTTQPNIPEITVPKTLPGGGNNRIAIVSAREGIPQLGLKPSSAKLAEHGRQFVARQIRWPEFQ